MQKTPCAVVETGDVPRVVFEQSTPVTVNWNLPSLTAVFSPAAFAEPDDEPPPDADGDQDEDDPPPLAVAITTMMMIKAMMPAG